MEHGFRRRVPRYLFNERAGQRRRNPIMMIIRGRKKKRNSYVLHMVRGSTLEICQRSFEAFLWTRRNDDALRNEMQCVWCCCSWCSTWTFYKLSWAIVHYFSLPSIQSVRFGFGPEAAKLAKNEMIVSVTHFTCFTR